MKAYPVYECNYVLSENWVITSNVMLARHFPPEDSHWIGHPPFWTNPNWYLLESTRTQLPSPHSQPSQTARRRDGQWKTDAGEATLPMDLWCGWAACRKCVKTWSCKNHLAGSYCFYIYIYIYIYICFSLSWWFHNSDIFWPKPAGQARKRATLPLEGLSHTKLGEGGLRASASTSRWGGALPSTSAGLKSKGFERNTSWQDQKIKPGQMQPTNRTTNFNLIGEFNPSKPIQRIWAYLGSSSPAVDGL